MHIGLTPLLMGRIPDGLLKPSEILSAQPKYDGIWFECDPVLLKGTTRDGYTYDLGILGYAGLTSFQAVNIKKLIGELVYVNPITGQITRDRSKVMCVLRKQKNWEAYLPCIKLMLFDVELYDVPSDITTWEECRKRYVDIFTTSFIKPIPTIYFKGSELYDIIRQLDDDEAYEKLEGVVVRRIGAAHINTYTTKEFIHHDMFKIKPVHDATLRCIHCTVHSKNPKLIGSLILATSDGKLRFSVGSGLKKEDRTRPPEYFLGKLIEIEFESISSTGTNLTHARISKHPIREDLQEADSFEKLKIKTQRFLR